MMYEYEFLLYSSDSETSLYEIDSHFGSFRDTTTYYQHVVAQVKSKLHLAPLNYVTGLAKTGYRRMKKKHPKELFPDTGTLAVAAKREVLRRRAEQVTTTKPSGRERLEAYRRREAERKPKL